MKWHILIIVLVVAQKLKAERSDPASPIRNPWSVLDYGDINNISWYGWFVIIYSLFVVIIVGSAIFLP